MAILVNRSYLQASTNLATDLARYGPTATWRGVYYRGEKMGFTVSQTIRTDEGFELQEDARLVMNLFGSTSTTTHSYDGLGRSRLRAEVVRVLARPGHRTDPGARAP